MFTFKLITTIVVVLEMILIAGTYLTQDLDHDAQIVNKAIFGAFAMTLVSMWG